VKGFLKKILKSIGKFLLKTAVDEVVKGRQEGRWEHGPAPSDLGRTIEKR
jgi:hypothetical protein